MTESNTAALLELRRQIKAPRERVFKALTQPEIMNQWFYGMDQGYSKVTNELKVGGTYVVEMYKPDGSKNEECGDAEHAPHGEYLEVNPHDRLVFTWISEGFVDHSVVTIELAETDEGTELYLKHELPKAVVEPHRQGWTSCLDHLDAHLES